MKIKAFIIDIWDYMIGDLMFILYEYSLLAFYNCIM